MSKLATTMKIMLAAAAAAAFAWQGQAAQQAPAPSPTPKGFECHDTSLEGSGAGFKSSQEESEEAAIADWLEKAKAVYRALGCRGLSRVDMFLKEDGEVVLNEVNTFPGMTSYSRYPRMMAAADLPLTEVIDRLVSLALTGKLR